MNEESIAESFWCRTELMGENNTMLVCARSEDKTQDLNDQVEFFQLLRKKLVKRLRKRVREGKPHGFPTLRPDVDHSDANSQNAQGSFQRVPANPP